ncbi:MAG: glycosyltransferase family 39 protein [Planctomycetota bacterium]
MPLLAEVARPITIRPMPVTDHAAKPRHPTHEPAPSRSWLRKWFIAVLFVGCITHGAALAWIRSPASPDAAEYLELGRSLSVNGELVLPTGDRAKRMPAYPALVAIVQRLPGDANLERGMLVVQAVLALCTTLMLATIARHLASPLAGVVAGLTSAFYGPFVYLQTLCLTETLLIFLFTTALLIYARRIRCADHLAHRLRHVDHLIIGLLLAIAALTRANAAILIIPFIIDVLLKPESWTRRLKHALALSLPTILCLTLWGLRNSREIGAFTLSTTGGLNFYLGHNPDYAADPGLGRADYTVFDRLRAQGRSEIEANRQLTRAAKAWAADHPGEVAMNLLRKLAVYHSSTLKESAPTLVLILFATIVIACRPKTLVAPTNVAPTISRCIPEGTERPPNGTLRPRRIYNLARLACAITALCWLILLQVTLLPWINPTYLVPIGLLAMLFLPRAHGLRRLFISLYLAELVVALAFIPLVRLRWTIDGLLIIAIAVAVARLCEWLKSPSPRGRGSG